MASIQKRANGSWRARYRDEAGKEHARHFTRKVDAQRWLDEVTASVVTGTYVDPKAGRITFDAWFRQWSALQAWAPMTVVQGDLVRRSVPFGDVPLAQLRTSHLQAWTKSMTTKGYAPNTVHTRVQTVRAALKAAVRDRRIFDDPSVGLTLPRRRTRERAMQVATADEVGRLIAACEPRMRAYIGLCAFAGLRLGEASGVNIADVDFLRRRLDVARQVQKRRGGPSELRAPKYESERTVFLPDDLLAMLSRHVEHFGVSSEGWLFTGSAGQPIAPTTVNSWWQRTIKAAGVPSGKIHSLRHFYASGLIAAGCDVVTVQRSLGHKSPSITLDTYSHLWPSAEDRTRQAAGGLAAEVLAVADSLRTEDVV
jgi:integrase